MGTSLATPRNKGLVGLFTVIGLLLGPAAHAQDNGEIVGAGGGSGFEYASPGEIKNCAGQELIGTFPGSRFELNHEGTYDGVSAEGTTVASYVGPTSVVIETGPYIISPEGTYTTCVVPGPVPINKAMVKAKPGLLGGDVDCPDLDGTFQRRAFDAVEFRLTGKCTVVGNDVVLGATVIDDDTTHVITGVMQPCTVPVPGMDTSIPPECLLDPDASAFLVTDYEVVSESLPNPSG